MKVRMYHIEQLVLLAPAILQFGVTLKSADSWHTGALAVVSLALAVAKGMSTTIADRHKEEVAVVEHGVLECGGRKKHVDKFMKFAGYWSQLVALWSSPTLVVASVVLYALYPAWRDEYRAFKKGYA